MKEQMSLTTHNNVIKNYIYDNHYRQFRFVTRHNIKLIEIAFYTFFWPFVLWAFNYYGTTENNRSYLLLLLSAYSLSHPRVNCDIHRWVNESQVTTVENKKHNEMLFKATANVIHCG